MDEKISRKIDQNSMEELSLSNKIMDNQSDWSRCNSFSSSSEDSTLFCSNQLQQSSFPLRKRLTAEDHISLLPKRSRNSSGSSASSNLSCTSEKVIKNMPVLLPPEPNSNIRSIESLVDLPDISASTLALESETLLNNGIPHPMSITPLLPFRHNLRRNIRKKTCNCDCTTTCTTVVVTRQYKGRDKNSVEEETVVTRTKVETYIERDTVPETSVEEDTPQNFDETLSQKRGSSHRSRRKSEMDKLYDSLHEITWAKDFSPDNILQQFDVRQAAASSAFGKSLDSKSPKKTRPVKSQEFTCNGDDKVSPKRSRRTSLNQKKFPNQNTSYTTRSKTGSTLNNLVVKNKVDKNLTPPEREKDSLSSRKLSKIAESKTYPVHSQETFADNLITEKKNQPFSDNNFNFSSTVQTSCSSCSNNEFYSKKVINFEIKSLSDNGVKDSNDYSSTFFDITEDSIHTIDACFHEVGAEVVVSTCYESDYNNLPLLTSVEELEAYEENTDINPPVLEPLLSDEQSQTKIHFTDNSCDTSANMKVFSDIPCVQNLSPRSPSPPYHKFFPVLNSLSLPEEDYQTPSSCFEGIEKNFHTIEHYREVEKEEIIESSDTNCSLPRLTSFINSKATNCDFAFDQEPPLLEMCSDVFTGAFPEDALQKQTSLESNQKCSISSEIHNTESEVNTAKNKTKKIAKHSNLNNSRRHKKRSRIFHKSSPLATNKHITKKYLKLKNSKSRSTPVKKKKISRSKTKNNSANEKSSSSVRESFTVNGSVISSVTSPTVSSSDKSIQQTSGSHTFGNSSFSNKSESNIIKSLSNKKNISTCESHGQTSESALSAESESVIKTFNQKLSYSKTSEQVSFNQISNSSTLICARSGRDSIHPSLTEKAKKSSIGINSNQLPENLEDIAAYTKILSNAKKKEERVTEKVKVPPRVFTCHYQTLNVTHGCNYIQIVLKITRGKSIFLTHESLVELNDAVTKASNDKDCRVLILNGFGQTFCLGLDLRPLIGARKNQAVGEIANAIKDLIGTLAEFHKPLVAIVNGAAFGLGLTILNHADITLATDNASFCMPYSKLGYMPEGGATLTLPQTVGTTVAMDLIMRGQEITAQQALKIGLINEVVEVHKLPQGLVSCVQAMAENSISGMETTKAMLKMRFHIQLPLVLETEAKLLPQMWLSPVCQESIQSALDSGLLVDC